MIKVKHAGKAYEFPDGTPKDEIKRRMKELTSGPDLKSKSILVYDHGLYTHLAKRLADEYGTVWYYVAQEEPYPKGNVGEIGVGIDGIERVYDFWTYAQKADVIAFFDVYNGNLQGELRRQGKAVCGAGKSEGLELDKRVLKKVLKAVGLPVVPTTYMKGLDAVQKHLNGKSDKWLKTPYYRGDLETYHYEDAVLSETWFDRKRHELGLRKDKIDLMIEDALESVCEVGVDGFMLDGKMPGDCVVGYEIKDKGYIGKVMPVLPKLLADVNSKMESVFKKLGYAGLYSNELRVTEDGAPYYIDATCRAGSPPFEVLCELYSNFGEIVWDLAHGKLPTPKPIAKYAVEVIVTSDFHEDAWLPVFFPKEIDRWVKLKNVCKTEKGYCCIPNDNAGFFGAVCAVGDDLKSTISECIDRAKQVKAEGLEFDETVFDKAMEVVQSGEKFGIDFS